MNKVDGHDNYDYMFMLDRIEKIMEAKDIDVGEETNVKSELPMTKFFSTTKTSW